MPDEKIREIVSNLKAMLDGTYLPPTRPSVDPNDIEVFVGLSRVRLGIARYELATGYELCSTYAHMFATPMVAFAPPPAPRAPHPAPWHYPRNTGVSETLHVQLRVERDAPAIYGDRLESIRIVVGLVRLVLGAPILAPLICDVAYEQVRDGVSPNLWALEPASNWPIDDVNLSQDRLDSIASLVRPAQTLLLDEAIYRAFSLVDGVWWLPTLGSQIIALWTAAETLMKPGRNQMTKALASSIRAYLGESRGHGDNLYQNVVRLYGARGSAAHAGIPIAPIDVQDSYYIVRALLLRAFLDEEAPPELNKIVPLWQS